MIDWQVRQLWFLLANKRSMGALPKKLQRLDHPGIFIERTHEAEAKTHHELPAPPAFRATVSVNSEIDTLFAAQGNTEARFLRARRRIRACNDLRGEFINTSRRASDRARCQRLFRHPVIERSTAYAKRRL